MPKYEILHSGEYWQTLRRAKAEREARRAAQPRPDYVPDGGLIFTFVPGWAEPVTSTLHPNGSLIPIPGLPVASSTARAPAAIMRARPKPRNGRSTNSFAAVATARATQEDAVLLARLKESRLRERYESRKRNKENYCAQTFRCAQRPGAGAWAVRILDLTEQNYPLIWAVGILVEMGDAASKNGAARRTGKGGLSYGIGACKNDIMYLGINGSGTIGGGGRRGAPSGGVGSSPVESDAGGVILEGGAGGAQLDICLAWRLRRRGGMTGDVPSRYRRPRAGWRAGRRRLAPVAHVVIPAGGIAP
ncbi:hypothetical protein B0H13DRAFT_1895501, partial [Mycena leptocephala]